MLTRRSLLSLTGTALLGYLLAGCRSQQEAGLRLSLLEGSLPAEVLREFERERSPKISLAVTAKEDLASLFQQLQKWQQQAEATDADRPRAIADLSSLGDYWLTTAIQQKLIQPIALEQSAAWQQFPEAWRRLVQRNDQGELDERGKIWAVPYRWGTAVIAYNVEQFEKLGWTPTDWSDLWRSPLQRHISILDSPRTVMGIVLKKLGKSINTTDLNSVSNFQQELTTLHQQVKIYSSNAYLQPLILGDTWAAVGWSTDLLPLMKRDRRVAAVVPASGTILTADTWVRPVGAATGDENNAHVTQWLEFLSQDAIALRLALANQSASPKLAVLERSSLPATLQKNDLLLPSDAILQRSEFFQPLANATVEQYRRLWTKLRQTS